MKSTRNRVRTIVAATAVAATCGIGGASFAAATTLPATATTAPAHASTGDEVGTLSLADLQAKISQVIDERLARIQTIAQRVAQSERLSAEQKAKVAQALADKQAALTKLKTDVNAQTTKEGVVKVLRDARRDGTARWWGERDHRWGDRHRDGDHRSGDRGDHRWGDRSEHRDGEHADDADDQSQDQAGDEDGDRDSEHAGDHDGERDGRR